MERYEDSYRLCRRSSGDGRTSHRLCAEPLGHPPEDPDGPDELLADQPRLWPDTTTFPFHYRHPVTGTEV